MTEFKLGDRVRRLHSTAWSDPTDVFAGEVYTVHAANDNAVYLEERAHDFSYNAVEFELAELTTTDAINPSHYRRSIEVADFIEAYDLDFRLGNVVKYVARHRDKGAPLQDLKKARWYLDRAIGLLEREASE